MRIEDVSPTEATFARGTISHNQSTSGKALCVALSNDGGRAYLGGHSGVWRSDDGGANWWHPEWRPAVPGGPTSAGALVPTNVYDLAIDRRSNDGVLAATGRDAREPSQAGIYRSSDGARSWALVHQFVAVRNGRTVVGTVGSIALAPDDPATAYAAGQYAVARTTDGGASWTESVPSPGGDVWNVVAGPARPGGRRVYAVGGGFWYSLDGGATWHVDPVPGGIGAVTDGAGASCRALAIHPDSDSAVYLMSDELTLWAGVFPDAPSTGPGRWVQLPSPPVAGGTDSGSTFVVPQRTPDGFVALYASDRRSVHGSNQQPASTAEWARAEDEHCHLDPHGLALSSDFRPWAVDFDPPTWGRALLVNDGGANVSSDGMRTWPNASGLSTLNVVNVGVNSVRGGPTAITFGTGDNHGFSSADGGVSWASQAYRQGDNDCSFSDPMQPTRMLLFAPRDDAGPGQHGEIRLFVSSDSNPPDTSLGSPDDHRIPAPPTVLRTDGSSTTWGWNAVSYWFNYGYRPLVLTVPGEQPRPDGDFVTIRYTGVPGVDEADLLRTTALSSITAAGDWVNSATADGPGVKCFRVGPPLPNRLISTVQASGGHASPTFYVGNAVPTVDRLSDASPGLWKLSPGAGGWQRIVPPPAGGGAGPTLARRYYVDPYRPGRLYVLGADHVYRSEDGGRSWTADASLEAAVTDYGAYPLGELNTGNPAECVLRDMQFDPHRPGFALAAGPAGVFMTTDGRGWRPLLRSTAVPMQPTSIAYDWVPCERAVYVGTSNRGLLRLRPLPPDWEFPIGSLRAAIGRITLLRVHDVGTGYGPPDDFLDAEVIVWLDSEPEKAFGFELRRGGDLRARQGMLALLRDCFNDNRRVRLEFERTGCRTGRIVRVIESS
jgi:hypothetical protein